MLIRQLPAHPVIVSVLLSQNIFAGISLFTTKVWIAWLTRARTYVRTYITYSELLHDHIQTLEHLTTDEGSKTQMDANEPTPAPPPYIIRRNIKLKLPLSLIVEPTTLRTAVSDVDEDERRNQLGFRGLVL